MMEATGESHTVVGADAYGLRATVSPHVSATCALGPEELGTVLLPKLNVLAETQLPRPLTIGRFVLPVVVIIHCHGVRINPTFSWIDPKSFGGSGRRRRPVPPPGRAQAAREHPRAMAPSQKVIYIWARHTTCLTCLDT